MQVIIQNLLPIPEILHARVKPEDEARCAQPVRLGRRLVRYRDGCQAVLYRLAGMRVEDV